MQNLMRQGEPVYVLDTDTYSQFLRGQEQITRRILETPPSNLYLCAITPEELLRGRLDAINQARSQKSPFISAAYDYLLDLVRELNKIRILRYNEDAENLFQSWPTAWKRAGSQDCRIAVVAVVNGFTVVTCNTSHFSRIEQVNYEDWSL